MHEYIYIYMCVCAHIYIYIQYTCIYGHEPDPQKNQNEDGAKARSKFCELKCGHKKKVDEVLVFCTLTTHSTYGPKTRRISVVSFASSSR